MKPLIMDCHAQLPLSRRMLRGAVTTLGWCLWAYMWMPIFGSLREDLGVGADTQASAERAIHQLFTTLGSHSVLFICVGCVFLCWSILQWFEKRRRAATKPRFVTNRQLAQSIRLTEEDLTTWQRAQRIVVYHDENSGWIRSAVCADDLLPLDPPKGTQPKRFVILLPEK